MEEKSKSYAPAKTIKKVFRLLEALGEKQPAKPSELTQKLSMTRSNLYRLLATLKEMGYVENTSDSKYILSVKMFMLGSAVLELKQLPHIVRPFMAHLAEISHENVNLAVMYEYQVLYVDKIESPHYLKLDQPIGKTDPLYCTALGKALLTGLSDLQLEVFLKSTNLIAYTRNTITDPEVLTGVIQSVRRQGYATDFEELSEGIHCISAPIRDHTNGIIAAISVSGPAVRLTKAKVEQLKAPIMEAAAEASRKMGFTNSSMNQQVAMGKAKK